MLRITMFDFLYQLKFQQRENVQTLYTFSKKL